MKKLVCVTAILMLLSQPLQAMDLQQAMSALGSAKSQGLVGEQPNGYLGVVGSSAQAKEIADLMGLNEKTVENQIGIAIKFIRVGLRKNNKETFTDFSTHDIEDNNSGLDYKKTKEIEKQ